MPWFTCSPCRIRCSSLEVAVSPTERDCPLCGLELELTSDLASLVGFRVFTAGGALLTGHELSQVLLGLGEFATDADAETTADELAAERWLDEGGSSERKAVTPGTPGIWSR